MTAPDIAPIDGATALALLTAAVEARGADYVYEIAIARSCVYVRDGQPSCLVGTALAIHGVPIDVMQAWDASSDTGIRFVIRKGAAPFITPSAGVALKAAQNAQDQGETWGSALEAARAVLGTP